MAKKLFGLYYVSYMLWSIRFPYMSEQYIFAGSKSGAEREASRIKKRAKWPYAPSIKIIKGFE